eukprot:15446699-Alexandrium_andersonii.AAC.1
MGARALRGAPRGPGRAPHRRGHGAGERLRVLPLLLQRRCPLPGLRRVPPLRVFPEGRAPGAGQRATAGLSPLGAGRGGALSVAQAPRPWAG